MTDDAVEALRGAIMAQGLMHPGPPYEAPADVYDVKEIVADLRAAGWVLERDWRPIEEAPRSGEYDVLAAAFDDRRGWVQGMVCWHGGRWLGGHFLSRCPPTHFRLPQPPKE